MSSKSRKLSHVYSVDGLRALALIAVVIFHIWPDVMPGGYFGVVIFFVLAGFFVSRNFVLEQTDSNFPSLLKYYRKRFIRLYLPLLAMVVFVNLFTHFLLPSVYANCIDATPSVLLGFNNFYQLASGVSYFEMHGNFKPFTHLWALALELQFYLIYPLFIRGLSLIFNNDVRKCPLILWIIALASGLFMAVSFQPGVDPTHVYYSSFARMFSFMIGGAFAFGNILNLERISLAPVGNGDFNGPHGYVNSLADRGVYRIAPTPFNSFIAAVLLVIIVMPFFFAHYTDTIPFRGGMFVYSIVVAWFVVLIYHDDLFISPFLSCRPLRFLSTRSYSYYIWQYPLMMIFAAALAHSTFPQWISNILQIVLLVLCGEVSYRLLERGPKKRPYLKTPELTAGIAPVLGVATLVMFLVAVLSPVEPQGNDADIVRQKIAEAEQQDRLAREAAQGSANTQSQQDQGDQSSQGNGDQVQSQTSQTPETPASQNDSQSQGSGDSQTPPSHSDAPPPSQPSGDDASGFGFNDQQVAALKNASVTVIGDSVVDMARDDLRTYIPSIDIDAKISRQMSAGLEIIKHKSATGELGQIVVVALGSNGDFNSSVLDEYFAACQGRTLIMVNTITPDAHEQKVNSKIKSFVESHANQGVYLADWYGAAKTHGAYFYNDHTHPKPQGAKVYDKLVLSTILKSMGLLN